MKVLISNDDGVFAPGIRALYDSLKAEVDCIVVAPDRDRSGVSSSLTLGAPLRPVKQDNGFIAVDGNPADCVHLAVHGLLQDKPDMVVSGINLGANLGDDVLYSGTVGAAMEGRFLAQPALALSLCSRDPEHLPTACYFAKKMMQQVQTLELPPRTILNINVPALPLDKIKGIKLTRLGHRRSPATIEKMRDPRGKDGYWIAAVGQPEDDCEGTDFHAVCDGFVSVTPLKVDQTHNEVFSEMDRWLDNLA